MKTLAVAALILWIGVEVFAVSLDEIDKALIECDEKTGVNKELVKKALTTGEVTDDPKLKDDIACFFEKMQLMNGDEVDKDKMKDLLKAISNNKSDDDIQKVVDACADQPGSGQEKMVNVFKCVVKQP